MEETAIATTDNRQVSVRMDEELLGWVDRRRGERSRAGFVRDVLRDRMAREREEEVRRMFDRAAKDLAEEEREEREHLVSGFADRD